MKNKHLYEIDFMRAAIMLGVISVHTVSVYNNQLQGWNIESVMFSALHASIEVTRMAFMFITGFVLFYVYYERDFHILKFWNKRFLLVGIPYLFWNIIYLLFIKGVYSPDLFDSLKTFMTNLGESLIHGNLFYLYYVLVTLQFYVVFPLMLFGLRKFEKWHFHIFVWSFYFQLIIMVCVTFVMPRFDTSQWPYLLANSSSLMLTYQCYFVAGGVAARHYKKIGEIVDRHWRLIASVFAASIVMMWGHYYLDRTVLHDSYSAAISVQQPAYLPYALLYIALIMFLGRVWDWHRLKACQSSFNRLVGLASKTSFGIFLVQPIPIYIINQFIVPRLAGNQWFFYGSLPFAILFVYFSSMLVAWCFYQTPVLSFCIGLRSKRFRRSKSIGVTERAQS